VYFRQILHEDLGCASYLLADGGAAAVVDPKWEIDEYLHLAEQARAEIHHVLETHDHADHVSGRARIVAATGAAAHVPADPRHADGPGLRAGDVIRIGQLELRALATPGHRPEHLSFVVVDRSRGVDEPWLVLSGDSVLIGDLARPDLAVAADEGADALWGSVRRLEKVGDHVELWPAHVGGSLCGAGTLSRKTSSTIGYERRTNRMLSLEREPFIDELTRCPPSRPPRVERVVALNRAGAPPPAELPRIEAAGVAELVAGGGCVLDVRPPELFDAGHLRGSLNLAAGGVGLGTRAGWATAAEEPVVIVAATFGTGLRVAERLYAAGVWNIAGVTAADPQRWVAAGLGVATAAALGPKRAALHLVSGEMQLLDVRDSAEWTTAHIRGSVHLPLSELGDGRSVALPADRALAVACASGARAALAASVLRRRGYRLVSRVAGGIAELGRCGAPLVSGAA
jgi:hydroxyacylglutathione hydrolase